MKVNVSKEKQINETQEFKLFVEEIDYLIDFFETFTELIHLRIISFFSEKGYYTLSTSLIDSSAQTLKSIKLCCSIGSFSDANTLVRKLRDDLIQYVYILNTINLRKPFIEEDIQNLKIDDPESFANSLENIRFNNVFTEDEQAVLGWLSNKVSELPRPIKKKLEFENYMNVLKQNEDIDRILTNYNLQEYWGTLRRRLNDYVHSNGVHFTNQNCVLAKDKFLSNHLKNINIQTSYISSFFLILILMVESSLISSTDYVDYLDCGMEPPEDSQYLIANFAQEFIDNKVAKLHPELKNYLKENNKHGMKID